MLGGGHWWQEEEGSRVGNGARRQASGTTRQGTGKVPRIGLNSLVLVPRFTRFTLSFVAFITLFTLRNKYITYGWNESGRALCTERVR